MKRGGGVHTTPAAGSAGWWNTIGRRVEHTIHRADGRISEKNSYGADPCPPKDGR